MDVALVIVVRVPPEDAFLEDEERHDAGEERAKHRRWRQGGEGLRRQRQQRGAEQGADSIGDEPGHDAIAQRLADEDQDRRGQEAADAAHDGQRQRVNPDWHGQV